MQVHIQDAECGDWFLLQCIPVQQLSSEPDFSGTSVLSSLSGTYNIRVAARNLSGLGATANLTLELDGTFFFETANLTLILGLKIWNCEGYEVIEPNHFKRSYCTYWEEFIFLSDHADTPKVREWINYQSLMRTVFAVLPDNQTLLNDKFEQHSRIPKNAVLKGFFM